MSSIFYIIFGDFLLFCSIKAKMPRNSELRGILYSWRRITPLANRQRARLEHRDNDFAACVPFFEIADGFDGLTERIAPVNQWFDLTRFEQLVHLQ